MRLRDLWKSQLQKAAYTFNPPSPIKVDDHIVVALWVDPSKEASQLAEEMKKSYPGAAKIEEGTTIWSPRMLAARTGVNFEITPIEMCLPGCMS